MGGPLRASFLREIPIGKATWVLFDFVHIRNVT